MLTCIIVDDEAKNIRVLKAILEEFCPEVQVLGEASDAKEAEKLISKNAPDLVLLDIEMPEGNAFDLLDRLMPVDFEVIFVTAFNEYSLKAFKYSAIDYLLKPIQIEELKRALQKAADMERLKQSNDRLNNLLANLKQPDPIAHRLALPDKEGLIFVPIDMIVRCEASKGYTFLYFKDGTKHLSSRNIKEYEELLPSSLFMRVHNSHIINLQCVKKYKRGRGGEVEMEDHAMIELATRRKNDFLRRFGL